MSFVLTKNFTSDNIVTFSEGELTLDEYKGLMCQLLKFVTVEPSQEQIDEAIQEAINDAFDYEFHNSSLNDISEQLNSYQDAINNIDDLLGDIQHIIDNV